jgi:hypothetical protein
LISSIHLLPLANVLFKAISILISIKNEIMIIIRNNDSLWAAPFQIAKAIEGLWKVVNNKNWTMVQRN